MKIMFFIITLISTNALADQRYENLPTYLRIAVTDDGHKKSDPLLDSFVVDERRRMAFAGDLATVFERCQEGWKCLDMGDEFLFVVPGSCNQLIRDGVWTYKGLTFTRQDVMDEGGTDEKYTISVNDRTGEQKLVAVYSVDRGLELLGIIERTGNRKTLTQYHLDSSSRHGALRGGCVKAKKGQAKKVPGQISDTRYGETDQGKYK